MSEIDDILKGAPEHKPGAVATKAAAPAQTSEIDQALKDAPAPARGFGGWARDIAATAVKGAIAVPEAVVGLADIPTGGAVGKFLENEGGAVGFRPKQAKEAVNDWHSDATKQAQQKFQEAEGLGGKLQAAIENPSVIATSIGESLLSMAAGGVAARGLMAATRLGQMGAGGAALAGAAGEGLTMAGSAAEQIRQETDDGLLTPGQAALAGATGLVGAAVGAAGGKVAQKLGIGDVDTMVAQGAKGLDQPVAGIANPLVQQQALKSIPKQIIQGAISEGFLEELPQSVAEQVFQNLALGKDWTEGVDAAIVLGTLSGAAMGGGAAGFKGAMDRRAPAAPEQKPANPGMDRVRQEYEARLTALAQQEAGEPAVPQVAPPNGRAILDAQAAKAKAARDAEIAASRAVESPDDEILQSTGATTPRSVQMGLNQAAGPMSAAAATAVDTGLTDKLATDAAAQAKAEADADTTGVPVVDYADLTDEDRMLVDDYYRRMDEETRDFIRMGMEDDDGLPDFDAGGDPSTENFLRALGASEQEIQDAISTSSAPAGPLQSAAGNGPAAQDDAGRPQQGAGADETTQGQSQGLTATPPAIPGEPANGTQAPQAVQAAPQGAAQPTPAAQPAAWDGLSADQRADVAVRAGLPKILAANIPSAAWDQINPGTRAKLAAAIEATPDVQAAQPTATATSPAVEPQAAGRAGVPGVDQPGAVPALSNVTSLTDRLRDKVRDAAMEKATRQEIQSQLAELSKLGQQNRVTMDDLARLQEITENNTNGYNASRDLHQLLKTIRTRAAGNIQTETPANVQNAPQAANDGQAQAAPGEARAPAAGNAAAAAGIPAAGAGSGVRADGVDDLGPDTFAGSIKREIESRAAEAERKDRARKPSPPANAQPQTVDTEVYRATPDGAGKFTLESEESTIAGNGDATPRKFASESDALSWAKKNGFKTATPGAGDVQADGVKIAEAAHQAATSPKNDLPQPTEAQKEAGNYQKGHSRVAGHDITIENPAGSKRRPEWPALKNHYGYFKGSVGADKDHVDVFMTDRADDESLPVFVVDQTNKDGTFDEHKVVMGAADEADARATYLQNYEKGWTGLGAITQMSQEDFKAWVRDPAKTKKPVALKRGVLAKMADQKRAAALDRIAKGTAYFGSKDKADEFIEKSGIGDTHEVVQSKAGRFEIRAKVVAQKEQAKPVVPQKPASVKDKAAALADYFTPGNIVKSYGGHDEVLSYLPADENGAWSVTVHAIGRRDGKWVRLGKPQDARIHSTLPDASALAAGPIARLPYQAAADVVYTEPRADGKPFPNAVDRGVKPAAASQPKPEKQPEASAAAAPASQSAAVKESLTAQEPAAQAEKPEKAPEDPPAAKKTAEKIEDFGEKLAGARKDYAATLKDAMSVDVAAEPLSKSWPEPDYQKLLDGGADPFMVSWVHAARDEIPTKPQTSWKLSGWVKSVNLLRKVSADMLAGEITKERLQEMLEKPEYGNLKRQLGGRAELYQAVGHGKSLKGITFMEHHYSMYRNEKNVTKWAVEMKAKSSSFGGWPREIAVADTKADALAQFKAKYEGLEIGSKGKGAASFVIYRKRGEAGAFIGKKIGREYIDLHRAEDVKAARTYLAENTDKLEKTLERYKDTPYERTEENAPRVGGDHRNGAPVTPEVFGQTFGFRGVQFGNYVEQGRRQSDLNEAFDALMDMAAVLGIPPKAISLNGRLGLAFGARGKGGKNAPAAHYEAGNVVINLTKGGGPGSLAHEWFHAMDNYFAKQGGGAGYMTDDADGAALREEMRQAFKAVKTAVNTGALKLRSLELDKRRTKPYWSTPIEMAARSFESYVIAKLQDQNAANDYLANVVDQKVWDISEAARAEFITGQKSGPSYPYPTVDELPVLRAAFDDFFKVVQTRETESGSIELLNQRRGEDAPAAEAAAVQSAIEGKSLVEAAQFVADTGSAAQREVAAMVVRKLQAMQDAGVNLELKVAHRGEQVPQDLIFSRGYTEIGMDAKGRDVVVWLNGADVKSKVGTDYETLLHELVHAATAGAMRHAAFVKDSPYGEALKSLDAAAQAIGDHITSRFEQADAGDIELTEFEQDIRDQANNAFTNLDEVVSWALTSREAQEYLDGIPYKSGSLWTRFVRAVRSALGLPAESDTVLSEVLSAAEKLMNPQDEGARFMKAFWHKRGIRMGTQQAKGSAVFINRNFGRDPADSPSPYGAAADPEDEANFGEADAPIFYSALRREIEDLGTKSASAVGWGMALQGLVKNGKVKADELEWTGIGEWLKLHPGKVSKEDVLAYLDANGVQVMETVLGDEARETAAERWMQERARLEFAMPFDSLDEADQDYIRGKAEDANITPDRLSKYSQYTLPGGENYREVLLTLPVKSGEPARYQVQDQTGKVLNVFDTYKNAEDFMIRNDQFFTGLSIKPVGNKELDKAYKSSHWDQPNVLAHIRVNDRVDADGKRVLFVEEIQSDFGQDIKKKGMASKVMTEAQRAAKLVEAKALTAGIRQRSNADRAAGLEQISDETLRLNTADSIRAGEIMRELEDDKAAALSNTSKLPRAPFVDKTDKWLALSLKRIMKMAVDGGYDAVAFVNGEQSAERYSLDKQISKVEWITRPVSEKGTNSTPPTDGTLRAWDKNGNSVIDQQMEAADLGDNIGKELAQKLIDMKPSRQTGAGKDVRELAGIDLKVPAKGMRDFYDKIVPAAVKDVLKKVGGGQMVMVEMAAETRDYVDRDTGEEFPSGGDAIQLTQPGFTITEAMREKVAGGLPLFAGTKAKPRAQGTPADRAVMAMAGEGKSADEILRFIANASKSKFNRQVANLLRRTGANPAVSLGGDMGGGAGFRFLAKYSRQNHEVTLSQGAADRAEQIFLHETVHAATLLALDRGGEHADRMKALYESVKKQGLSDAYGMKNVGEFVAEAFTNKEFQKSLKGYKAPGGTAWDRFVAAVRRILGMSDKSQDALSAALELGAEVMRENMPLRAAKSFRAEDAPAFAGVDQTETPEFKRWFGDSKVVDSAGKPLVVYRSNAVDSVLSGKTQRPESGMDGLRGNAELVSNLLQSPTFRLEGLGGFDAPTQRVVLAAVRGFGLDPKVLGSVVELVPVDVVNVLAGQNLSPESLFSDEAVLKNLLSVNSDRPVTAAVDVADALVSAVTGMTAKAPGVSGDGVGSLLDGGSASGTGEVNVFLSTHGGKLQAVDATMVQQKSNDTGNRGTFDPEDADIAHFGMADAASLKQSALDQIHQTLSHPGKVSMWDKTVGTMRNLAERSPAFKPVFEAAQRFIDDVSMLANETADVAPRLLPRVESWRDLTKKPVSAEDNKAISKPLFEGTLMWGRDTDGKPVLVDDMAKKYADLSPEKRAKMLMAAGRLDDRVLRMWQGLPEEQFNALVNSRFESQMLKAGVVWTEGELKSLFSLNDQQISLYREARQAIDRSIDLTARADMLRALGAGYAGMRDAVLEMPTLADARDLLVETLHADALDDAEQADRLTALINTIADRFEKATNLMKDGYAPLSRFGRYTVDVVDDDGQRQYFGMAESMRDANQLAARLRAEFPGATVTQGTMSAEAYKLFAGITPESLELFGNMLGLDAEGGDARDKAFQEYLRLTKNNYSALKRLMHRKGTAGYSEDVGRVLASFVYSNARQAAGGLNAGTMEEAVNAIPKEQGELKDVAMGLRDYVRDPQEEGQAVRGMLFAQYLGGSVASAFVNMTQPVAVTLPWLSQFGGMKSAGKHLAAAFKDMAGRSKYEDDLQAALDRAEEDGVVSPQEIHQLMAQARGAGGLRSGDGTRAGDARAAASNAWERTKVAWGQPFALAEQFNRRSTFIAAYRMAKERGMKAPAEFARRAVLETQFLYSKANKPKWARGVVGGTLFTFKTYSVSYLELLNRMATAGRPGSPERAAGRRAVAWAMGTLMLMGGAGGLPFMEDLEDLIDGIAQLLGYNVSAKQWRRQALQDIVGKELGDFIDTGVSGLPGAPVDVSGRLGMGNLLPGTGLLLSKQNRERDLLEVVGPAGDLVTRGFTGARKALSGDIGGAALELSPTAVRNAAKGIDMAISDRYTDAKGYKVLDTTLPEAAAKAIGFQPRSVAKVQEANGFMMRSKAFYTQTSAEIKAQWARALFEKDDGALQDVRERLADWNRNNPDQPIVVKMPDVWKRVREMGKDRTERIADTAPKALRQEMRNMAREAD